jgi:hypothetical protein
MRAGTEMNIRTTGIFSYEDRYSPHRYKADESCVGCPSVAIAASALLWLCPVSRACMLTRVAACAVCVRAGTWCGRVATARADVPFAETPATCGRWCVFRCR